MSDRPNLIYILGDDHRVEQLGHMGHPMVRTPNIDQLASEGVVFRNGFCTSPACTPSRTCHYLGQWERKHGINFSSGTSLAPEAWENSFPMRLKQEGYFLGWVGKNHVPAGEGGYGSGYFESVFDYWYGNHRHSGFYPKEQARGGKIYRNARLDTQVEVFEEGALNFLEPRQEFLERCVHPLPARPSHQPFCLCVTFSLPHAYGTGNMELRPSDDEIYRSLYRDRFGQVPLPKTYVPWERTTMDRMIGRLRAELSRLGLDENTVIICSTDHGIHHGEHGLGGKCFLYEEDLRIPFVLYDPHLPRSKRGQVRDEFALVPDLAPTVLELIGVEAPETMQGQSLVPLMRDESVEWRRDFFTEQLMDIQNYPRSESVRTKDWKYIRYFARAEDPSQTGFFRGTLDDYNQCLTSTLNREQPIYEELFDLQKDEWEEHNLAGDPAHSAVLDKLRARILVLGREARGDDAPPLTIPV